MMYNVLVVDDDEYWRTKLAELFGRQPFGVTCFSRGADLLQAIMNDKEDLYLSAIVDLILQDQELQGPALCKEIKSIKPYLPVFAATVSTDPQGIADAILKSGFDGFIAKAELEGKPQSYIDHVRLVIERNVDFSELSRFWREIVNVRDSSNQFATHRKLLEKVEGSLKKAFYYIMLPDMPLLQLVLTNPHGPYNDSIIQSAIAIESIIRHEDKMRKKRIAQEKNAQWIEEAHTMRVRIIRSLTEKDLFPSGSADSLEQTVFKLRNRSAHSHYQASRKQALDVLGRSIEVIGYYLSRRQSEILPIQRGASMSN